MPLKHRSMSSDFLHECRLSGTLREQGIGTGVVCVGRGHGPAIPGGDAVVR
jgi:hypothetical protein